jgi:hypothetical protein
MKYASTSRSALRLSALLALPLALGCAKVVSPAGGDGGHVGGTAGNSGSAGVSGGAGRTGAGGSVGVIPDAGGGTCQTAAYTFTPKIPTVYLAVDRSGSMFHCLTGATGQAVCPTLTDTSWSKFKDAALMVVSSLQSQVRFGFATIVGTNPTGGGTCPILDKIAPALNNSDAIATLYNSLPPPPNSTQVGVKFETPANLVLRTLGSELAADTTPGPKYILFVTDGQPDYCDDSNALCAPDSVIYALQTINALGVTSMVMGIQTKDFDLAPGVLQAFANAGAGEPTVAPLRNGSTNITDFYYQCNGIAGWVSDLAASGKAAVAGVTLGTYSAAPGPTQPYAPDPTNASMLATQLGMALSGVKTCTFDLADPSVAAKPIIVDTTQLNKAHISFCTSLTNGVCNGPTEIPLDPTNGWRVNCVVPAAGGACKPTQIEILGNACSTWRMPDTNDIKFDFPCEVIIPG